MNLNIILNDIFKEKILLASTADSEFQQLIIANPGCKDYLEYDIKLTKYNMFLKFKKRIKLLEISERENFNASKIEEYQKILLEIITKNKIDDTNGDIILEIFNNSFRTTNDKDYQIYNTKILELKEKIKSNIYFDEINTFIEKCKFELLRFIYETEEIIEKNKTVDFLFENEELKLRNCKQFASIKSNYEIIRNKIKFNRYIEMIRENNLKLNERDPKLILDNINILQILINDHPLKHNKLIKQSLDEIYKDETNFDNINLLYQKIYNDASLCFNFYNHIIQIFQNEVSIKSIDNQYTFNNIKYNSSSDCISVINIYNIINKKNQLLKIYNSRPVSFEPKTVMFGKILIEDGSKKEYDYTIIDL